ncbi:HTH domain-containing protein [Alkalibacillus haloalkaliphilus]|uniref:HTH domain-containing protein n=1 Tax=Alkalibacillus haloalkaliphilus TaxID=94136 RepID=UPI002936A154|nr:HTH domain-containing protein [Alkalibacillus haloalkaliphilus]MDV2581589.1 DUF6262 family protein [Alkalibacillus haloalkaliphilus]
MPSGYGLNELLDKIEEAITSLRRGKKKLSITLIADRAGISRKTIYNHIELKERCNQAITIQKQESQNGGTKPTTSSPITSRKLLEDRYKKAKIEIKKEKEKNAKLLENNRQLVIENATLKSRIEDLQERVDKKVVKIK